MEKTKKAVVLGALIFFGTMSFNFCYERIVAYHLMEKDQNALYRLRTAIFEYKEDTDLQELPRPLDVDTFIENEINHIEHGIQILAPNWLEIAVFFLLALLFGNFCFQYGKSSAAFQS